MSRSTTPNLVPFIRSVARETVKAASDRLPTTADVPTALRQNYCAALGR